MKVTDEAVHMAQNSSLDATEAAYQFQWVVGGKQWYVRVALSIRLPFASIMQLTGRKGLRPS